MCVCVCVCVCACVCAWVAFLNAVRLRLDSIAGFDSVRNHSAAVVRLHLHAPAALRGRSEPYVGIQAELLPAVLSL